LKLFHPDFPFAPRRMKLYYGWIILPAAILGVVASIPGQTAGFSAFTEPLLEVSGLTRFELSICYFTGTFISGLILPRAGKLLDSWGVRQMTCVTCIGLAVVLVGMSQVDWIVGATVGRVLGGTAAFCVTLTIGILGLRFFGQGMLPIIGNTLVGRWFEDSRGRAVAIMSVFNGLAFSSAPYALDKLVNWGGWEHAWLGLAAVIGIGGTLLFWAVHRESPEACGITIDGTDESDGDSEKTEMTGETVEAATASRAFWACLLPTAAIGLMMTAVTFHIVAFGAEAGVSKTKALTVFVPISMVSIPIGFVSAWLSKRLGIVLLLRIMAVSQMGGYVAIQYLAHPAGYVLTAAGLGIACGLFGPVQTIALPQYFGRLHLGAINGRFYAFCVLASAVGPALFAGIEQMTGSFFAALYVFMALPLAGLVLTAGMRDA
jgi:MFS family permease